MYCKKTLGENNAQIPLNSIKSIDQDSSLRKKIPYLPLITAVTSFIILILEKESSLSKAYFEVVDFPAYYIYNGLRVLLILFKAFFEFVQHTNYRSFHNLFDRC